MLVRNELPAIVMQLIGGLADEKVRWQETVEILSKILSNIIGDILICSGSIAYLGFFNVSSVFASLKRKHFLKSLLL